MDKNQQIKRNHHYVWGFYLKNWAQDNNVYYISKKGKVSCDSVRGLAKELDFYKINPLNIEDVEFIKRISSKSPQSLQDIHMLHLSDFIKLSNISNFISQVEQPSEEIKSIDKKIRHNSLEDLHSIFEDLSVDVISQLAEGNVNILKSKQNMMTFCSYLGHQISRTKAFRDTCLNAIKDNPMATEDYNFYIALWEKNWWFLSFIFGLNIGISLYENKNNNHIFISNNTTQEFITSDCPIINIHSSLKTLPHEDPPMYADFYIPLSPKYAYMINNSSDYNHLSSAINSNDVEQLNQLMFNKSYKTIFASSDTIIRNIKTHNKM